MLRSTLGAAALMLALGASPAVAQDYYGSVSLGASWLDDSDNSGALTSDFTTGAGTTIPAGTVLPSGTGLGWTTEFDEGYALSAAIGRRFGPFRGELELAYQDNDVDTHNGVTVGGGNIDAEDAGVLITGSPNLGVTVGELVDDGQGSVDTTFLFANGYYDFTPVGPVTPYIGAGVGVGFVNVDYSPSGVTIVDDDATVFAYQLIGGASFDISERTALFAQYRYRATEDVETDVSLFDANLDIENRASIIEAGVRFRF
ncbi:MAG: outer membrane beta-barrel protein [Hyphomonadaceae bacterium]|nr:outer membrane beta-barrel protein [Hyphomonadaceae bacterium]